MKVSHLLIKSVSLLVTEIQSDTEIQSVILELVASEDVKPMKADSTPDSVTCVIHILKVNESLWSDIQRTDAIVRATSVS